MHLTMIFVDGFGLGTQGPDNPIYLARTPHLDHLLGGHRLYGEDILTHQRTNLYPLDATLEVPGTPQSATGQAALWTGLNTAKALGFHLNAYPNDALAEIINQHCIFKQLKERGKKATFANAFSKRYEEMIQQGHRKHSASTLCALAGGLTLRQREELLKGHAIYQDITNEEFNQRGEEAPLIQPVEAGKNLANLSLDHDFVLFEYFQTDLRGHRKHLGEAVRIIERLDEFIGGYLAVAEAADHQTEEVALIITSDHGNIEDISTADHTLNKVPAICWSNFGLEWPLLQRIEDVTPAILRILGPEERR